MVHKFVLNGIVYPERVDVNISRLKVKITDSFGLAEIDLSIVRSRIICFYQSKFERDIFNIRNSVLRGLTDIINYVGFLKHYSMNVFIESITNLKSYDSFVFGVEGYSFSDAKSIPSGLNFRPNVDIESKINPLLLSDPYFCRAIQEIRNSIAYPDYTALHSKLAIDAVQSAFEGNDSAKWEKLKASLKVTKARLNSFKDIADDQRHGKNRPQTWEQRRDTMQVATEVVHRYSIYKANSNSPVSLSEF